WGILFKSSLFSTAMQVPMAILRPTCFIFLTMSMAAFAAAADPISEALLSLKSAFGANSDSLNDWFVHPGTNASHKIFACSWSGVTCDQNATSVVGLDLSMKNLGGSLSGKEFSLLTDLVDLNISHNSFSDELPIGIFDLTKLKSLDISRNNFSGRFPSGIFRLQNLVILDAFSNSFSGSLPAEVSQLQLLKVLNFAGSYFSGPIPSGYGSLHSLEFIHLAGNLLSGNLPPELGVLKKVTHMEIGYNSYQGSIPLEFGNMSELQYLDISGANISGKIPTQLSNLTKLTTLFLFRNRLSGLLPSEFSKIKNLTNLDLSDNLLSGEIPQSFSELKSLRLLSLMYNEMSGAVPQGIARLPNLDSLFIWNNFFSGSLPEDLGKYSKLRWVDVSTNNFVGGIPPDICAGGELFKLILFSNKFSGGLFPSLSNCSSLVRLRIEDNLFSGYISLRFSNLPDIVYVDLSRNRFTGGIPTDISQAPALQYFNVSSNSDLGGMIPPDTWSLPLIQNFSASACNISGQIPSFEYCKSVSVIELNLNHLSGSFPDQISNCKSLESMNLANNDLTGHIPEEVASVPILGDLDLSHNKFNGQIPLKLGNSTSLKVLNVSFNDLSGSVPSKKIFRLMGSSAFAGNPKLCGAPLRSCHRADNIPSELELGSKRTQKLAWVLILCAVVVLFITALAFVIFYLLRRSKGKWKMVSYSGLPQFTANDILRSFDSIEVLEAVPLSGSVCKAVLPTGITVLVRKIEWEAKRIDVMLELINRMGNARHKNLIRLLGFCSNKHLAYLMYDYLPNGNLAEKIRMKRDWAAKCKIMIGIARGLCFLHHDCYPAIAHGDVKACNVVFDENREPRLAEYGLSSLKRLNDASSAATISSMETGEFNCAIIEELHMDIYNFGELILEISSNGRLKDAGRSIQSKPKEVLLGEIYGENEVGSSKSLQEEISSVIDVVLLCTRSRPSDRPSMKDALKLLSGLNPQRS
ncbi:hypothetical protein RJ639_017630, partial [Escallonia herrerae]